MDEVGGICLLKNQSQGSGKIAKHPKYAKRITSPARDIINLTNKYYEKNKMDFRIFGLVGHFV